MQLSNQREDDASFSPLEFRLRRHSIGFAPRRNHAEATHFQPWNRLDGKPVNFVETQGQRFNAIRSQDCVDCLFQGEYNVLLEKATAAYQAHKPPVFSQDTSGRYARYRYAGCNRASSRTLKKKDRYIVSISFHHQPAKFHTRFVHTLARRTLATDIEGQRSGFARTVVLGSTIQDPLARHNFEVRSGGMSARLRGKHNYLPSAPTIAAPRRRHGTRSGAPRQLVYAKTGSPSPRELSHDSVRWGE